MFEAQAAYYLNKYLGKYLEGVDSESLSISVWNGDIQLKNLRIRPEALADLHLPLSVSAGILGSLRVKVPWKNLGSEPVIVEIDKLYILATPLVDAVDVVSDEVVAQFEDELVKMDVKRKLNRVKEIEDEWLKKFNNDNSKENKDSDNGFLQYYIDTILGNLEIKITSIHIRYEDDQTTFGERFSLGFCLSELSAYTVDEDGKRAFVTAKGKTYQRKAMNLERLAFYFETNPDFYQPKKPWLSMSISDWDQLFLPSIGMDSKIKEYLLRPIDGKLQYEKKKHSTKMNMDMTLNDPRLNITLHLKEVGLSLSRKQYLHTRNILSVVNLYQLTGLHRHLRPPFRPRSSTTAQAWWRYGCKAVRLSILGVKHDFMSVQILCQMRKAYVPEYAECLREGKMYGNNITNRMDQELSVTSILAFRQMAHAQIHQEKKLELEKKLKKQSVQQNSWVSWIWGGGSTTATLSSEEAMVDESDANAMKKAISKRGDQRAREMTSEDWAKLQEILGDFETTSASNVESDNPDLNVFKMRVSIAIDKCYAILLNEDNEVLCGSMTHVNVIMDQYNKNMFFEYIVSSLALTSSNKSVMRTMESNNDSLNLSINLPNNNNGPKSNSKTTIKFKTTATCYLYDKSIIDDIIYFFYQKDENEFSALEAKAVATLMKARSLAQKTITQDLKEAPLLDICVDMKAPKIAIPSKSKTTLIVDFGHLNINTKEITDDNYETFEVVISEVAIYVKDEILDWTTKNEHNEYKSLDEMINTANNFFSLDMNQQLTLPILEKCAFKTDIHILRDLHNDQYN